MTPVLPRYQSQTKTSQENYGFEKEKAVAGRQVRGCQHFGEIRVARSKAKEITMIMGPEI